MEWALVAAALLLAFMNGANDNFKGVATLHGSGRLAYGPALTLATISTAAGSLASIVIAAGLVRAFSGKGLIPAEFLDTHYLTAVAAAAALTVLVATRTGMPISTTHSIVGALVGAGLVLAGSALDAGALGATFLLPLAVGPLLALVLAWLLSRAGGSAGSSLGLDPSSCVCVTPAAVFPQPSGALASSALQIEVAHRSDCASRNVVRVNVATALDAGHLLSASAVGFARGLNDTPKILGLLAGSSIVAPLPGAVAITVAMAAGGVIAARRVAETLSHQITPMTNAQGLAANLCTSILVIFASRLGLPVSTTHVSTGGIFGIGASNRTLSRSTTSQILGSWLATLPFAAALGALFAWSFA